MAGDGWSSVRLGEVCIKIGSGATPRGGGSVYFESGLCALIRSQNVHNDGFHREGLVFIGEEHALELSNVEVQRGDVLLNITGDSVARCCQVDESVLPARVNQHVAIVRPDPDKLAPRFLRYFMISPEMQAKLRSWAGAGGTRNALTKGMIESLEILAPDDLNEQHAIAYILGTLDDKIELNRRMNETLQAIAWAIFTSWFADFDPVRAKISRRNPALPEHLRSLFPDSFEDTDIGEIPKGWTIKSFADTVEILGGGTPKTSVPEYWNGPIPWFSIVDAPRAADVWVVDTEKKITKSGVENSSAQVLPEGTTIITARGTVGRIALVGVPMAMNQSCYALRGKSGTHGFFTFFTTRELVSSLLQNTHGSIFDTITRNTFAGISAVVPPAALVDAFELAVSPTLERIRNNLFESSTLKRMRDSLLPKLMSGKPRIRSAERLVERAM